MVAHSPRSSVDTVTPRMQPRAPSPPDSEEDLGRPSWHEEPLHSKAKDKGPASEDDDNDNEGVEYPPTNDEEAETRRVEENLRKLEIAERQRRKAKRESEYSDGSPSVFGRVARSASLLWSGGDSKGRPTSSASRFGSHTALQSRDSVDEVPLEPVAAVATPPRANTPENPFSSPADGVQSPFADPTQPAIMNASETSLVTPTQETPTLTAAPKRPVLVPSSSSFSTNHRSANWTPAQPLDLPPPKSPPPLDPAVFIQPAPIPPPKVTKKHKQDPEDVRWWHDWLCGLSEGPDRGGDKQSGRTNPFE